MLTVRPYYLRSTLRGYLWAICLDGCPISLHMRYPGDLL